MQKKIDHQAELLEKARKEADDAQRGAIAKFNEQKRYKSHIQRLQSDTHRFSNAVDKMRTEAVSLRSKINDLRDERSNLERQLEFEIADSRAAIAERDSTIADLHSLLERCNQDLDALEQSVIQLLTK
jgi:predicted RNase H-like nuclease (RuvC/YqgF family)